MKLFSFLQAALLPLVANALFFHMEEGETKCFIEEVPGNTIVVGKYKIETFDTAKKTYSINPKMGITVRIQNPDGEKIMDKVVQNSPEKFAFTTVVPGEHYVCLSADAGWIGRGAAIKVYFDVVMGEGANDYDEIRRKDKLDDIQLRVRQLLDQINQISKEQAYQRVREARFRHTSEATNSRVIYWSCAQFAILIVAGLWQTRHLRGFFEAKKLV